MKTNSRTPSAFDDHRPPLRRLVVGATLALSLTTASFAQEILDQIDEALSYESPNGLVRADLSGTIDAEWRYVDQNPPGLIFADDEHFFNPRMSLFLDAQIGDRLYALVQSRFDRGFDPGSVRDGDVRLDEYFLRYSPLNKGQLNLQVGKMATVFGGWVPRHLSWDNPFINAPLAYENVTIITDHGVPGGPGAFLGRQGVRDNKPKWLPMIWGPSYTSGASVFGAIERFDYAFEFKNASISSRPYAWEPTQINWEHPTISGRIGYRPSAMWNVGSSFSYGTYLLPNAQGFLPAGTDPGDFKQLTIGTDVTFAWHHWQVWAEAIAARFEVPNVGDADTLSYFVEAKYKLTPKLYGAARWNQQFFDDVPNGAGGFTAWDQDAWRIEGAVGYRWTRHLQTKLQYGYSHQKGPFQQGEQQVSAQMTVKF
ncbi:MAG: hypothetical protein ACI9VS_001733 [Candidatus Binatia bacterium]|jgi:hypothetical protein